MTKILTPSGATAAPSAETAKKPADPNALKCQTCVACGARRPYDEIEQKACGNCANLSAIEQEIASRAEREADAQKAIQRAGADLKNLPDLDKTASCLYDDERGVVWVGFNLKDEKLDPFGLAMLMDQAKAAAVGNLVRWRIAQQQRKSKIVRVVESVGGMMDRLSSKTVTEKVKDLLRPKL
jgi:hypothetical protein